MALIKNEIPILEYDTEARAVLMPGHGKNYKFTKTAVMLFMEAETDEFAAANDCEIVGTFISITKVLNVYKVTHNGVEIVFCQAPLGSAGAVQIMEQLIAGGAKKIIAAGCCGALVCGAEGEFFVPTAALRHEGTSYHYLPPTREVELNEFAIKAIETVLNKRNLPYRRCKTWTTDGFYRETKEMVLYRKSEGYSVVEMECAALAACAQMRGVEFGQLLFTADSLANADAHDERNWGNDTFGAALEIAMDVAVEVGKQ